MCNLGYGVDRIACLKEREWVMKEMKGWLCVRTQEEKRSNKMVDGRMRPSDALVLSLLFCE